MLGVSSGWPLWCLEPQHDPPREHWMVNTAQRVIIGPWDNNLSMALNPTIDEITKFVCIDLNSSFWSVEKIDSRSANKIQGASQHSLTLFEDMEAPVQFSKVPRPNCSSLCLFVLTIVCPSMPGLDRVTGLLPDLVP